MDFVKRDIKPVKYNCKLEILSPIHIGSGNTYGSYEYVTINKKRVHIDILKYYASLPEDLNNFKEKFLDKVVEDDFNLNEFNENLNKRYRLFPEKCIDLEDLKLYECFDKTDEKDLDIHEHIKSLNFAYIPGSSLKGAIETAILYNLIDEEIIKEYTRNSKKGLYLNQNAFKKFLENSFASKNHLEYKAQYNIMRFFTVLDSQGIPKPTIYNVSTVTAKFNKSNKPDGIENSAIPTFLETIDLGRYKTKSLKVNLSFNKDELLIDALDLNDKKSFLDINYIKKAIYLFSKDVIDEEIKFAKDFKLDDLSKFYKDLKEKNTEEDPVLRIGQGSGLFSTSIALKLKKYNDQLFKEVFNLNDGTYYPKSRRLCILKKGSEMKPLGWVKLTINEKK